MRALSAGVKTVPFPKGDVDISLRNQGCWVLCVEALPSKTAVKA